MQLHFLGTTGYHPNNRRQTACLMLPESGMILDAGTGLFRARPLIRTRHLDILLSHVHLDHSIGLTYLYDVLRDQSVERVTVHVAEDKVEAIERHLYARLLFPVQPNFEIRTFGATPFVLPGDCRVTPFALVHPGGSHGFRLDWPDRSLAYVTDTTARPGTNYAQAIRGVGTLVHECNFRDGFEDQAELTGHSCLSPVIALARSIEIQRLFLVHINPLDESDQPLDLKPFAHHFAELKIAEDGMIIDV